jgi:hypothetical protein
MKSDRAARASDLSRCASIERTAIAIAAIAGSLPLVGDPAGGRMTAFGIDAWLAPWRDNLVVRSSRCRRARRDIDGTARVARRCAAMCSARGSAAAAFSVRWSGARRLCARRACGGDPPPGRRRRRRTGRQRAGGLHAMLRPAPRWRFAAVNDRRRDPFPLRTTGPGVRDGAEHVRWP